MCIDITQLYLHRELNLNINMSLSGYNSPTAQKRGPSTPLAPAKSHNKRQYTHKTPQKEMLSISATDYQRELLECKYTLWLTQQQLEKEKSLKEFLELEKEVESSL